MKKKQIKIEIPDVGHYLSNLGAGTQEAVKSVANTVSNLLGIALIKVGSKLIKEESDDQSTEKS